MLVSLLLTGDTGGGVSAAAAGECRGEHGAHWPGLCRVKALCSYRQH